jgi:hypothetical protein
MVIALHRACATLAAGLAVVLGPAIASAQCEPRWEAVGLEDPSAARVLAQVSFDDGRGRALYVAGEFEAVRPTQGSPTEAHVARITSDTIEALPGLFNGDVLSLAAFDEGQGPRLFAAGRFSRVRIGDQTIPVKGIARWDGVTWTPVAGGLSAASVSSVVYTLGVFDTGEGPMLHVGGAFLYAGEGDSRVEARSVARWDGTRWSAMGAGFSTSPSVNEVVVRAFAVFDRPSGPRLHAAGRFGASGAIQTDCIAAWEDGDWARVPANPDRRTILAMTPYDDGVARRLYLAINYLNGETSLVRFDGTTTEPVPGATVWPSQLCVFDDGVGDRPALYGGGFFGIDRDGSYFQGVFRYDGATFSNLEGGLDPIGCGTLSVDDLGDGPRLTVGGDFALAGADGVPAAGSGLAFWDGASWSSRGDFLIGGSGAIGDLEIFQGDLYAGGDIRARTGDGSIARALTRRTAEGWSAVPGLSQEFGLFDTIKGLRAVRWNGSDQLVMAGSFTDLIPGVGSLARFDGEVWRSVPGLISTPSARFDADSLSPDPSNGNLVVAGNFGVIGNALFNGAARIAPTGASPFSPPPATNLRATSSATRIENGHTAYYFAAGGSGGRVLRFDEVSGWSQLGGVFSGLDPIHALAFFDDGTGSRLIASGSFRSIDGIPFKGIAQFANGRWQPLSGGLEYNLASGTDADVSSLAVFDDGTGSKLYVGGALIQAFNGSTPLPVSGLARWDGQTWESVGLGVGGETPVVTTLRVLNRPGSDGGGSWLYIAGGFIRANAIFSPGIARYGGCGCRADFDANGQVDFFDYLDFVNAYSSEAPGSDFNRDGQTDAFDYLNFAQAFDAGC